MRQIANITPSNSPVLVMDRIVPESMNTELERAIRAALDASQTGVLHLGIRTQCQTHSSTSRA
jgi:hypothetical protein